MREIGATWLIGVLTGKPCPKWVIFGVWHYINKERVSRGLDGILRIPSTCLDAFKKRVSIGIYSLNRASEWLRR